MAFRILPPEVTNHIVAERNRREVERNLADTAIKAATDQSPQVPKAPEEPGALPATPSSELPLPETNPTPEAHA